MFDSITIGIAALAFLVGYATARMDDVGALERQWKAGYIAGERATLHATRAVRPEGGDHG
ncbi:hypothetical protein V5F32_01025 [Xanthobacter oligotrophicus]|uniref:Uncharacterized protein n=1 Tax=Xanthobacter oligotrophicus TaxID=2607286 RepID=A0ABW6ZPU2_9HYPH